MRLMPNMVLIIGAVLFFTLEYEGRKGCAAEAEA